MFYLGYSTVGGCGGGALQVLVGSRTFFVLQETCLVITLFFFFLLVSATTAMATGPTGPAALATSSGLDYLFLCLDAVLYSPTLDKVTRGPIFTLRVTISSPSTWTIRFSLCKVREGGALSLSDLVLPRVSFATVFGSSGYSSTETFEFTL